MKRLKLPILSAVITVFSVVNLYGQDYSALIKTYITTNKIKEFKKSGLNDFAIDVVDVSSSLKGTVVKFQQVYNGLPVNAAIGTALIKDGRVDYFSDNFIKDFQSASSAVPNINKETALGKIALEFGNSEISNMLVKGFFESDENFHTAKQRLVYFEDTSNNLKLAYEFTFPEPKSHSYWNIFIDAKTGAILDKQDLNLSCSFHEGAYGYDETYKPFIGPLENNISNNTASFLAPDAASYNVFAFPMEAPTFGSRTLLSNPWNTTASPEGWHSDGTTHYTTTRGNNVYAYQDLYNEGLAYFVVDGGASRNFDFPFDINKLALDNANAALTNLFYANNQIHDVFYKFGFKESSRNFQKNNFGLGGSGNDFVIAEGQDGGGLPCITGNCPYGNANFSTPQDGGNGRMQMYLWMKNNQKFFYNAPAVALTRNPQSAISTTFGLQISGVPITGNVKLSPVLDACTALPASSLSGFIGLAEKGGSCDYPIKVKNMQDAGAIGALIYNNAAGSVSNMTGYDPSIYIHAQSITNAEGGYIKNQLANGETVNVSLGYNVRYDGSLDNGIMIHEYGHGISNRLTGTGYNCLNTNSSKEQMGEGWSDFFAMMLTNKPGDNATVARGMATYASGQSTTGAGIRPAKYSPDMTVNPYTYGMTNGMEYSGVTDVHSIGFVWATMLWDLHWEYVEKYGYASDVTANPTSGSARVLQLVTDALKLQTCNPTFIDGRNAILSAELATTGGADKCIIWRTFARRGLGLNASAGSKTNINDQVENFSVPTECMLSTNETSANTAISIYPNPAKNEFFINFPSKIMGKIKVEIYDASGKLVSNEDKISPADKHSFSTEKLQNGVYVVKVSGLGYESSTKLVVKK